jgi:transposase-like protein
MANTHTVEFKIKAVEETLNRPKGVTRDDMAVQFNISPTTLSKWIKLYREDKLTIAGSINQSNTKVQAQHQEQQKNQNHYKPIKIS